MTRGSLRNAKRERGFSLLRFLFRYSSLFVGSIFNRNQILIDAEESGHAR